MELNQSMESLMTADVRLWSKRMTNLEKCLVIIISFGVCAIIACLVNIAIRGNAETVCTTRSCIKKASEILKQIDVDIYPCNDFFKFSCGKLINTTHEKQTPHKILRNQIEKQLHVLSEPVNADDHPIIIYQKKLFKACINESEGNKSFETMKEILKDMGGWPVVEGNSWNDRNFDLVDAVGKLRKFGLEFSSILTVSLTKVSLQKKQKIIQVNYPFSNKPRDEFSLKFMVDVAVIFGANKTSATREMSQVQDLINSIEKFRDEDLEPNDRELQEVTQDKLQIHQQQYPGVDWLKLINVILEPVTKIDAQDVVIFPNSKFMQSYLNLINRTPPRVLSNYILWYAVDDLLDMLSSDLQSLYNDEQCLANIPRKTLTDICKLAIKKNFGPIPSYLAYAKKHLTKEVRDKAEDVYMRVKSEFVLLLKKLPISSENRNKVEKTFDSVGSIIGLKDKFIDDTLFDKFFKGDLNEPVEDKGFLRTYLHFKWKVGNIWLQNVHVTNMQFSDLIIYYQIPRTDTMYIAEEHAIAVPVGMLHNLFYESDKSMLSHFATLGRNLGSTLAIMFNDMDIRGEDGKDPWSDIIEIKCVSNHTHNNNPLLENTYEKNLIAERIGLKTAYNAYRKWAVENPPDKSIPGLYYNPNQLFWISSMSELCFDDAYDHGLHRNNLGVRQNSDFVRDFVCDSDEPMSSSSSCDIFENE
ncbi:hypothetical protein FQR65_LT06852 [Abscondita terminalis]|nr:hypothetical protein FQR65_LT06852 [Abscondita terminalis]